MAYTVLRLPDVKTRTGLSRSSIYLKVSKKEFPTPIPLGNGGGASRAVGWIESEIDAWVEDKIQKRGERHDAV